MPTKRSNMTKHRRKSETKPEISSNLHHGLNNVVTSHFFQTSNVSFNKTDTEIVQNYAKTKRVTSVINKSTSFTTEIGFVPLIFEEHSKNEYLRLNDKILSSTWSIFKSLPVCNSSKINKTSANSNADPNNQSKILNKTSKEQTLNKQRSKTTNPKKIFINNNNKTKKRRNRFSKIQLQKLEGVFKETPYIDVHKRLMPLSKELGVKEKVILNWFQNRRQKAKTEPIPIEIDSSEDDCVIVNTISGIHQSNVQHQANVRHRLPKGDLKQKKEIYKQVPSSGLKQQLLHKFINCNSISSDSHTLKAQGGTTEVTTLVRNSAKDINQRIKNKNVSNKKTLSCRIEPKRKETDKEINSRNNISASIKFETQDSMFESSFVDALENKEDVTKEIDSEIDYGRKSLVSRLKFEDDNAYWY